MTDMFQTGNKASLVLFLLLSLSLSLSLSFFISPGDQDEAFTRLTLDDDATAFVCRFHHDVSIHWTPSVHLYVCLYVCI